MQLHAAVTSYFIYKGRSINKLQNSIISVIFKVWKIQIYVLYGILCWVPAVSFITMTSLSTLNAATLPFKVSRNEQYSVIRFPWAKASTYAIIHPELCPVHSDQQHTLGVISLLIVKKVLSIRNDLAAPPQCCFDGGQVILYRQHFLDYEQTSWIKMCIVDLVKHFSLYTGHI